MASPVSTKTISLRNPPSEFSDTFKRRRRRFPAHPLIAPDQCLLGQFDGVEARGHIRPGVSSAGDLVKQLRGHGSDRHSAAGPVMLGDHTAAIGVDLRDREPGRRMSCSAKKA